MLLCIDQELAGALKARGCECGGVLHSAAYPRKPRGCLSEVRALFESRLSFCCALCRKRSTAKSVRFLGRRIWVAAVMVLCSARRAKANGASRMLMQTLPVPVRTRERWRRWWQADFVASALWRAEAGRFVPPASVAQLPASLIERFVGEALERLKRLLLFLAPLSVAGPIKFMEGR